MELLYEANIMEQERLVYLRKEAEEILKILVTARKNSRKT
jgi:hypothetical protein